MEDNPFRISYGMNSVPIKGLGIDIIEIERIKKAIQNPRFIERILTQRERDHCKNDEQIAGRFCAKEAVMKALGKRFPWQEIEIVNEESGVPRVILHGNAGDIFKSEEVLISISHSRTLAVAVAILITGSPSREETP